MSVSLGLDGDGLGTCWGRQLAMSMLADAGFGDVAVREIESDPINNYYIARKSMSAAVATFLSWRRGLFVTDGGLETELVFHDGIDLPALRRSRCSTIPTPARGCAVTTTVISTSRASTARAS